MNHISEITDEQMLEILMTSDFNEETYDDLKEMVFRFRKLYRILHSKYESKDQDLQSLRRTVGKEIDQMKSKLIQSESERANLEDKVEWLGRIRKLSLIERLKGKTNLHK